METVQFLKGDKELNGEYHHGNGEYMNKELEKFIGTMNEAEKKELLEKMGVKVFSGRLTAKVSTVKGGICVYGLQRNPVTLYANQWEKLIPFVNSPEFKAVLASPDAKRK